MPLGFREVGHDDIALKVEVSTPAPFGCHDARTSQAIDKAVQVIKVHVAISMAVAQSRMALPRTHVDDGSQRAENTGVGGGWVIEETWQAVRVDRERLGRIAVPVKIEGGRRNSCLSAASMHGEPALPCRGRPGPQHRAHTPSA